MRHPALTVIALTLICAPAFAGIGAPVTSVVLYPGGATVTRTAQLAPGGGEIVVALPANFNPQTLRVQPSSGISVGGITTQDQGGEVNPALLELNARIQALRDQQTVAEAEIASAGMVREYLERFVRSDTSAGKGEARLDPKTLSGLVDTVGRGSSEAMVKIQKLHAQNREAGRKIEQLQRLSAELKPSRVVTVKVAGAKGGSVSLSYQLHNAGWKPGYRAGLDSVASTVELERLATIAQNTGEDWSNVRMTLSTSRPHSSPGGQEPQPWLLSWHKTPPVVGARDIESRSVYVTGSRIRAEAAAPAAASAPALGDGFMSEIQTTFATEFEVPGRISLASDGREVQVAMSSQALAVRQHMRVAPRLDRSAIVIAEAARPEGVWPAGPIQLFRDGHYVGSAHWNQQNRERIEFAFGRDDLIGVLVSAVDGKSGTKGLFGTRSSRDTADVFTLVNHHKTPVDVVVLEASPVSTSDEVKVQARFEPKLSAETWQERRGVVAWNRKLAVGETAKFQVEYRIDFPKEGELTGMR